MNNSDSKDKKVSEDVSEWVKQFWIEYLTRLNKGDPEALEFAKVLKSIATGVPSGTSGSFRKADVEEYLKDVDLETEYGVVAEQLLDQGFKCKIYGNAGVICEPCPLHPEQSHDGAFLDLMLAPIWKCIKDNADVDTLPVPLADFPRLQSVLKKHVKVKPKDRDSFREDVVERSYLSNNIIISIEIGGQEGYEAFRYNEEKGVYVDLGPGVIITELEAVYKKIWSGERPPVSHVPQMKRAIYEKTVRPEGLKVFLHDEGDYFYLPTKGKDLRINRVTGEVQYEDLDPVYRPFLYRLQREVKPPKSQDPPKILKDLLNLVPPQHHDNMIAMLVSPLLGRGRRLIFYNFSRTGGNGKTTFFNLLERLYGQDLVLRLAGAQLKERFALDGIVGKTALLIEDYPTWGIAEDRLLTLASPGNEKVEGEEEVGGTIRVEKKFRASVSIPLMFSVIVNSNMLAFNPLNTALMDRLVIIPWIRKFPPDAKPPEYSKEEVDELLSWLIHVALPRHLRGEIKVKRLYDTGKIAQWAWESRKGVEFADDGRPVKHDPIDKPANGINRFVEEFVCDPNAPMCVLTEVEEAFRYYLKYCEERGILPLADKEFEKELDERNLLKEKDGEIYVNLKKGLLLFM